MSLKCATRFSVVAHIYTLCELVFQPVLRTNFAIAKCSQSNLRSFTHKRACRFTSLDYHKGDFIQRTLVHFKKCRALHFKMACRHFKIAKQSFQAKPQLRNSLMKGLNTMTNNIIADLSMDFSVAIVNICDSIKGKSAIVNQLLRSGTSIGANIHEANYASSRADFIAKMQIALKECRQIKFIKKDTT